MPDTGPLSDPQASTELTVLVVDDSKTVRRSASGYLSQHGWSVEVAADGFEALAKVVELRPAIAFLDIMMPRLDGYQTCALIKQHAGFQAMPVVLLSSRDGLFDRARGRVVGADDHLAKPFSAEQLIACVEQQLAMRAPSTSELTRHAEVDETVSDG